jgi:hypothetical protein
MDAVQHRSDALLALLLLVRLQQSKSPNLIVDPLSFLNFIFSLQYLSDISKTFL